MPHDHEAILQKVRQDLPTDELLCDLASLLGKCREERTLRSHQSDEHVRTIVAQDIAHLIGQQGADR